MRLQDVIKSQFKIRLQDSPAERQADEAFAAEFKQLTGLDWPIGLSAEWAVVLHQAGFDDKHIEQFLATIEAADGEPLPQIYTSTSGPSRDGTRRGDAPIFTARLMAGLRERSSKKLPTTDYDYHVTLSQMAAIVSVSPKTIRRNLYDAAKLPAPAEEGGAGKAHKWAWSIARPILEQEFNRQLPEVFPADTLKKNRTIGTT
ncbi:MAG: hypothetical protein WD851_19630 [Pirellulales bacterium]